MDQEYLLTNTEEGITTITFNRPEQYNAFNDIFIQQLTRELTRIEQDPKIRVVLLTANGQYFSAGADIQWMQRMVNYSTEKNQEDALQLAQVLYLLNHFNKPTIALVQGTALGGGIGLVACCDIAIATEDTTFCFSEVKLGLIPAAISPYVLAAIGSKAARRYFLTAEHFTAAQAVQMGLIHEKVKAEELTATGQKFAHQLLGNGPLALNAAKQLIHHVAKTPLDENLLRYTAEIIAKIRVSPEAQKGLKAFLEKRKPIWD